VKGITEQYQIAYIELDRELELDKVCDIFTQINSKGVRLDVFDLFNALLKPKGLQLKHMWRAAEPQLDFVETERMNVYILQVMSILQQAYCSPKYLYYLLPGQEKSVREPDGSLRKEVLVQNTAEFEVLWMRAVEALNRAIGFFGILKSSAGSHHNTCRTSRSFRSSPPWEFRYADYPRIDNLMRSVSLVIGTGPVSSPTATRGPLNRRVHAISST
jgi:hypothetical protein